MFIVVVKDCFVTAQRHNHPPPSTSTLSKLEVYFFYVTLLDSAIQLFEILSFGPDFDNFCFALLELSLSKKCTTRRDPGRGDKGGAIGSVWDSSHYHHHHYSSTYHHHHDHNQSQGG